MLAIILTVIYKSYSSFLLAVAFTALFVFLYAAYRILKSIFFPRPAKKMKASTPSSIQPSTPDQRVEDNFNELHHLAQLTLSSTPPENHDICSIAGDDVMRTQLDLARAYIETGKSELAKQILNTVISEGNKTFKEEAQLLLKIL